MVRIIDYLKKEKRLNLKKKSDILKLERAMANLRHARNQLKRLKTIHVCSQNIDDQIELILHRRRRLANDVNREDI